MYALISVISVCGLQCNKCHFSAKHFEPVGKYIFQFEPVLVGVWLQCIWFHTGYCRGIKVTPCCFGVYSTIVFCGEHFTPFLVKQNSLQVTKSTAETTGVELTPPGPHHQNCLLEGAYKLQVSLLCPKLNKLWECVETEWQEPLYVTGHIWGLQTSLEWRGSLLSCARALLNSITCGLPGTWFC